MTGATGGASLDVCSIDWGSSLGEVREILDGSQDGDAGDQSMATGPTDRPSDLTRCQYQATLVSCLRGQARW